MNPVHARSIDIVVGGQYGSEGKGAVAAAMTHRFAYNLLVRVAGPNAGHTVIDHGGRKFAFRQIPAAGVINHSAALYIAPGSEVDFEVLKDEMWTMRHAGIPVEGRLFVSPEATIIEPHHHEAESAIGWGNAGSTRKGVGAARAARALRTAHRVGDYKTDIEKLGAVVSDPDPSFAGIVGEVWFAMLEGTQGYWLGTHAGLYPYCTSSDCRAIDFLAMSGMTWDRAAAMVVFRSFPIRIAGNSGPLENEITWEDVGVPAEYTTVTKKVRRVGRWEPSRVEAAIEANYIGKQGPYIAMTFMDYLDPGDPDRQLERAKSMLPVKYRDQLSYIGNGPNAGFWPGAHK